MPNLLQIPLHTVTPIWTGGANKDMDRIHETGLIGSFRWWYELLARGMGGQVKKASDSQFNKDEYQQHNGQNEIERLRLAGLCDVAQVFGATGWKRRFRLVVDDHTKARSVPRPIRADRPENRGWYFPGDPQEGNLDLTIQSLHSDFKPELIGGLIQFLSDWAAIGAKNQLGMGVVDTAERIDTTVLFNQLKSINGTYSYPSLPSMDNLFLAAIRTNTNRLQETFNLKYDLREQFRSDAQVRHFIMGTVKGSQRQAAKIKMSWPDQNNTVRVWGWVPHQPHPHYSRGWDRERIITSIHEHLSQNYDCLYWNEMNTSRDTNHVPMDNKELFLKTLLKIDR